MAANGFTGTVVSGSGLTYQVTLNTGSTVTAFQLSGASSLAVPAGTKVLVVLLGGNYYFQAPVWG